MLNNFLSENHTVYEIMWKNFGRGGQDTDANITRRMPIACWITKAIDTLRAHNTYRFSTTTMVTRTRLNTTFYVHCLCCFMLLLPLFVDIRPVHVFVVVEVIKANLVLYLIKCHILRTDGIEV
jgi:hypothetical protein